MITLTLASLRAARANPIGDPLPPIMAQVEELMTRIVMDRTPLAQWQPMDTAPRDGSYMLLAGDSGFVGTPLRVEVCRYDPEFRPRQPWVTYSSDSFLDSGAPPIYWMPLPQTPEDRAQRFKEFPDPPSLDEAPLPCDEDTFADAMRFHEEHNPLAVADALLRASSPPGNGFQAAHRLCLFCDTILADDAGPVCAACVEGGKA